MNKYHQLRRKALYYETDSMKIVHHSNYIRWFEEVRTDFLLRNGFPYSRMEELGVLIPVLAVECQYKTPVTFEEEVIITSRITKFGGAKFEVSYEIRGAADDSLKVTGKTMHCFVDENFHPIRIKTQFPEIYKIFSEHYSAQE